MYEKRRLTGRIRLARLLAEAVEVVYDLVEDSPELDGLARSVLYAADLAELALEIEGEEPFEGIEDRIP